MQIFSYKIIKNTRRARRRALRARYALGKRVLSAGRAAPRREGARSATLPSKAPRLGGPTERRAAPQDEQRSGEHAAPPQGGASTRTRAAQDKGQTEREREGAATGGRGGKRHGAHPTPQTPPQTPHSTPQELYNGRESVKRTPVLLYGRARLWSTQRPYTNVNTRTRLYI